MTLKPHERKSTWTYWLPRILSIAYILFVSVFALDVFTAYSGWGAVLPLFIHLIPSFVLLLITVIAWKHDLVGAVVFLGIAILYVLVAGFDRPWSWYAGISGPSALVGILYLLGWWRKQKSTHLSQQGS